MRILQVHCRYRLPGGEEAVVAAEAEALTAAGHDVALFEAENAGGLRAGLQLGSAVWNPRTARRFAAAAVAAAPDVVHVHNTWYGLSPSVVAASAKLGLPTVMTLHNYRLACTNGKLMRDVQPCELCLRGSTLSAVRHACYRDSRPQSAFAAATVATHRRRGTWRSDVDRYISMTAFAADRLAAGGLPRERISLRPHPVTDPGPRTAPPSASATVVFAGRLQPDKGVERLLQAWPTAPDGLRLLIAGDGPQRAELERSAPPGVTFAGQLSRDELKAQMLAARALAFPSTWYETQGLTLTEALAAGLPVLASDLGVAPEVAGGAALLAEPGDDTSWHRNLAAVADDALVDRLGRAARARYEQAFTPAVGLRALESIYAAAIEDRR